MSRIFASRLKTFHSAKLVPSVYQLHRCLEFQNVSNIVRTFEKYIADRQHSAASSVHMHLDQKTVAVAKAGLQSPDTAWLHNRVRRVHVEFIYTMSDTYGYVG